MERPVWMRTEQVMEALNVSIVTLVKLIERGEVEAEIPLSSVNAYKQRRKEQQEALSDLSEVGDAQAED
jgi:hypothetical protein